MLSSQPFHGPSPENIITDLRDDLIRTEQGTELPQASRPSTPMQHEHKKNVTKDYISKTKRESGRREGKGRTKTRMRICEGSGADDRVLT